MTLVDPSKGYVYICCPTSGTISVFSYSGNLVTTISGEPGAEGMVVVADRLFVALSTSGAIDEIDTTSLTSMGTLASGLGDPESLVYAAGRLWVSGPGLSEVDPSTGAVTNYVGDPFSDLDPAGMCQDPVDANLFLDVGTGSTTQVFTIDGSSVPPVRVERRAALRPSRQ
jgi:DNA-binding beta-propeller fold protein YncE